MSDLVKLKECPKSPNCVSTQTAQSDKQMQPLPLSKSQPEVMEVVKRTILSHPRTALVEERSGYLHFTFKSLIFRFIDDVEFVVDDQTRLLHFRSASRVGYSDLGANRQRMEELLDSLRDQL